MANNNSFRVGAVDKAFRYVKTEKGWKPLKKNFDKVNPRLAENKRHVEDIRELRTSLRQ